jgi:serine/threonine protein kinase
MAIQIWQPGDKIKNDRFKIVKQLGKGSFGITYLAEDTIKKQQVVIKTLNANEQGEADFAQKQENFINEGFTLKTFNHPHIVKVYKPINFDGLWGLVMEYIPGQDLADYIIANGRLVEAESLNYIDQIAQALDCVHQHKFFHRDVKPDNIMLRQDRGEVVLIDFGIAKEFVDLKTMYLSNIWGSEYYKPIEQFEKSGRFGAYTDIYSLAASLYHLLTGSPPGGGSPLYTAKARKDAQDKGWGANLDKHLWGELANAGVSERTQAAIKAGMTIEPSQRPQTMIEFRQLLGSIAILSHSTSEMTPKIFPEDSGLSILDEVWNELSQRGWPEIGNTNKTIDTKIDTFDRDLEAMSLDTIDKGSLIDEVWNNWKCPSSPVINFDKTWDIEEVLEKALPDNCSSELAEDFNTWISRGWSLHKLGRDEEAIDSYDRALKICMENHHAWTFRGLSLYELGRNVEAVDSLDRALKINAEDFDAWLIRGFSLEKLGRNTEAVDSYDCALDINSENFCAWIHRGSSLEKLGRYEEAAASYHLALIIEPSDTSIWIKKSEALTEIEQYERAINSYDRALEINPNCHEAYQKRQILIKKLSSYSDTK